MSQIAVLIPCYNEEQSIAKVVKDFKHNLPQAVIYVYDNNSTDNTAKIARQAGAIVRTENRQGKGCVVRRMFADIDADIYLMVDGDGTYDATKANELITTLQNDNYDMVVGTRVDVSNECYRKGHRSGNFILTKLVQLFFNYKLQDMLSGYRAFSRRFVKTFPAISDGFEIETELTIYALSSKLPIKEIPTNYFARQQGSVSKLSTYKDGLKILRAIVLLLESERPLLFFSLISFALFTSSIILIIPIITEYLHSGLVPRLPTAILASAIMLCSIISELIGWVLDSVANAKKENRRQNYLHYNQ